MKQVSCLLSIVTLLCFSTLSYGQLTKKEVIKETTIGKLKQGFIKYAELSYSIVPETKDTLYHLYYKDLQFKQIDEWKSIFFKGGSATLNELYKTLKEALSADKGKETAFDLGETSVFVITSKMFGSKYLFVSFKDKYKVTSTMNITKGQLDDLFGIKSKEEEPTQE